MMQQLCVGVRLNFLSSVSVLLSVFFVEPIQLSILCVTTRRERELVWFPFMVTKAIGECAGEVGNHGKWMEVMYGFVTRSAPIYQCGTAVLILSHVLNLK